MDKQEILSLLRSVAAQDIAPEQALLSLKQAPFADIDYAKIDLHRGLRQGGTRGNLRSRQDS